MTLCLSVLPHDISKADAAKTTKLDIEMFDDESWNPIYFRVKRSKVKVTSHENVADVGLCTLASAGFFYSLYLLCFCVTMFFLFLSPAMSNDLYIIHLYITYSTK